MRKFSEIGRKRWIRALILSLLYLVFLVWVKSWMGLIVLPFIVDALTTRIIKWDWWRQIETERCQVRREPGLRGLSGSSGLSA